MIAKDPDSLIFQRGPGIHFPKVPDLGLLFFVTGFCFSFLIICILLIPVSSSA